MRENNILQPSFVNKPYRVQRFAKAFSNSKKKWADIKARKAVYTHTHTISLVLLKSTSS